MNVEDAARLVAELKGCDEPGADESLVRGGLLDSVDVEELAWELERRCGVEIPPREITLENFDTVRSIAAMVHRLAETRGAREEPS
jgi:acyl carrier protein